MKKITRFMLGTLLFSGSLFAEIAFNLDAQHFSKAIEGTNEGARYELTNSYVSTNLKYTNGTYTGHGYFDVELKTPSVDWSVGVDVWYVMGSRYRKTRSMKFTSENGESIIISFKYETITFNNKVVYTPDEKQRLTISLTQDGSDINLVVNGFQVDTASRPNFGKLKYVDIQNIYEDDNTNAGTSRGYYDDLYSLTIGSK